MGSVKLLNHKDLLIVELKVNVERDDDDWNRVKRYQETATAEWNEADHSRAALGGGC